ncbi:MAG: PadR family transcriptional regulator [Acidimicrobiales bacterium]
MRSRDLTTTAYAVLGLLAIRPWTAYDLARQMERSLHNFWPRAESNLTAAAKTLAANGLASARTEYVGRRPRVVYSITAKGRTALRRWVPKPGTGPVLEFENLLKIFYAEHASRQDLLDRLAAIKADAEKTLAKGRVIAEGYATGAGPFPARMAINALVFQFVVDHAKTIWLWADWAEDQVQTWPESPAEWPQRDDVFRAHLNDPFPP